MDEVRERHRGTRERAALSIADGTTFIPYRCATCKSVSVTRPQDEGEVDALMCVQCGRTTTWPEAKRFRRLEIAAYILNASDLGDGVV